MGKYSALACNDFGKSVYYGLVIHNDYDRVRQIFKLYIYTAIAPVPLSSFAGETTSFMGKSFLKSYVGVCMEGAVIVLSCIIFSAFASNSTPTIDTSITTVTMIWKYIGEVIFNMLVLVGLIKGADRIVKELFGT